MEFLNPALGVVRDLSLPVKVAWGVWLVWAVGHAAWSRWGANRSRSVRPAASTRESGVRPAAVRPSSVRRAPPPPPVAPYGTSDFIAALDQEQGLGARAPETTAYR